MATQSSQVLQPLPLPRSEIDTSAPFESVKEAANLFGGMGFWKPIAHNSSENILHQEHDGDVIGIVEAEEEAAQLERDLMMKERETLDVLKELETTRSIVEELKLKLQGEVLGINVTLEEDPYNNKENIAGQVQEEGGKPGSNKAKAPGFILQELKQAKLNLTRTTKDLADIRASVDLYNKKIEKERMSLEKTHQRLCSYASKISCDSLNITMELQKLSSETEQFKKVGETAKLDVLRAMYEIKQTKGRIRNAELRLVAAKRMKEAAKASEAVALAEIKALSKSESKDNVTLTFEQYSALIAKAQEAEKACNGRVADAMLQVDEADVSKTEILKKIAEATEEVKTSKKALEEVLSRVEAVTRGKLEVEDALRTWRSKQSHKRRSLHKSARFKNCHPSEHQNEPRLIDANNEVNPVLKPTLSIGQILSRKLLLTEEYENGNRSENIHKVSLGQMLRRRSADMHSAKMSGKENCEIPGKRRKFGLARIPLLVVKQSKKKKNTMASPMRSRA